MKAFLAGFLLSTLLYAYALSLKVTHYRQVLRIQQTTMDALGNTCQQWYNLFKDQKKPRARPQVRSVVATSSYLDGQ